VAGLVYVFVWEAALAAYLDGIRFLSVRRFALAIVRGLDDGRLSGVDLAERRRLPRPSHPRRQGFPLAGGLPRMDVP
jgi:hypothetical protein